MTNKTEKIVADLLDPHKGVLLDIRQRAVELIERQQQRIEELDELRFSERKAKDHYQNKYTEKYAKCETLRKRIEELEKECEKWQNQNLLQLQKERDIAWDKGYSQGRDDAQTDD